MMRSHPYSWLSAAFQALVLGCSVQKAVADTLLPRVSFTTRWLAVYHCLSGRVCGCAAQVLTLLRGVYLHLLFLPALLSAPLCMGLGVGREAWLLLMRWTLERAGPVRPPGAALGLYGHAWASAWARVKSTFVRIKVMNGRCCCW